MTRKESQRKLGLERIATTTQKLVHALERMRKGSAQGVWSKQTLAREAGIDESTLFRKKGGKHIYAEVLEAFEAADPGTKKQQITERDQTIDALTARNRKLELSVAELSRELQKMKDREKKVGPG